MNNLVYVGVVIVIVIVIAVAYTYTGSTTTTTSSLVTSTPIGVSSVNSSVTTTASVSTQTTATTTSISSTLSTTVNTTKPAICSDYSGYVCVSVTCTPVNSSFSCSNATYIYSPTTNVTDLYLTFSQKTGREWSSFGVGYAPTGTKYIGSTPQIPWYTANYTSKSNVGTSLQSNQSVFVKPDNSESGATFGPTTSGSVWVCYTNSGLIYVGSAGCIVNGGGSSVPTYIKIGTISET